MTTSKLPSLIGIRSILKVLVIGSSNHQNLVCDSLVPAQNCALLLDPLTSWVMLMASSKALRLFEGSFLQYSGDSPGTGSLLSGRGMIRNELSNSAKIDSWGVSVSLGGGISSGGKKSRESNIGGSDNTRDGGTSLDPSWSELELHLSFEGQGGDKAFLVAKGCDRGACKLLGDVVMMS
ncbi:hypothetical protein Tco_0964159 [Tanacetum coccineum]